MLAGYAQILGLLGRDEERQQAAEAALATARRVGARREEGRALGLLDGEPGTLGDVDGTLANLLEARRIADEQADVDGLGWACLQLAWVSEEAGRLAEALAFALEGAEASRRLGSPRWHDGLQATAANMEFRLGRWDEADRHLRAALERDWLTGPGGVHIRLERARLDIARGDFAAARRWLEEASGLAAKGGQAQSDAQFGRLLAVARAELALWEGRDEEAFQAANDGLAASVRAGDEGAEPVLFALGLAATADRAERARAHRNAVGVETARREGDELYGRLEALVNGGAHRRDRELAVVLTQGRAEHARLHDRPDPATWAAAAAGWEALGQPYPAACARLREAEALLASRAPRAWAEETLRAAYEVAVRLGAVPLRRELERLAQRGRVQLQTPAEPVPVAEAEAPSVARSLGLTRREAEVLALLAEGRTNRQIGQELFITEKTASIHVSRILAKLGVAGRGEAAAVAHRLGIGR